MESQEIDDAEAIKLSLIKATEEGWTRAQVQAESNHLVDKDKFLQLQFFENGHNPRRHCSP